MLSAITLNESFEKAKVVPLNDYFLQLQKKREENSTTTDFMKLMDYISDQKQNQALQSTTLKDYRKKPLNSKDSYQKSTFVQVSVPSSAQEVYMNASNISFYARQSKKLTSHSKNKRRGLSHIKGMEFSDSTTVIMPATSQAHRKLKL